MPNNIALIQPGTKLGYINSRTVDFWDGRQGAEGGSGDYREDFNKGTRGKKDGGNADTSLDDSVGEKGEGVSEL